MAVPVTYIVIAARPVVVEDGGTAISYPPGAVFTASPNNPSVMRLLELDQIRPGSGAPQPGSFVLVAGPAGPPGPPGPAADLAGVLTAGDTADAGQRLRFNLGDDDTSDLRAGTWTRNIGYGSALSGEGLIISVAGEDILAISHETDDGTSGFDPMLTMPVDSAIGWTASASVTADHIASFGFYDTPANGHELYFTAPRFAFFEGPVNGATAQRLVLDNGVWDFGTNYLAFSAAFDGTGPSIRAGANSPEGVVSAAVGSIFLRSDGASGTTVYTKVSGSGNTGWEVLGGGSANDLAATLAAGNTTGANDIIVSAGQKILVDTGASQLSIGGLSGDGEGRDTLISSTGGNLNLIAPAGEWIWIGASNAVDHEIYIGSTTGASFAEMDAGTGGLSFNTSSGDVQFALGGTPPSGFLINSNGNFEVLANTGINLLATGGNASLTSSSGTVTVAASGATQDLILCGRGASTNFNQAGQTTLHTTFTDASRNSIIGALNSIVDGTTSPTLAQTLARGNTTGANNIVLTDGQEITSTGNMVLGSAPGGLTNIYAADAVDPNGSASGIHIYTGAGLGVGNSGDFVVEVGTVEPGGSIGGFAFNQPAIPEFGGAGSFYVDMNGGNFIVDLNEAGGDARFIGVSKFEVGEQSVLGLPMIDVTNDGEMHFRAGNNRSMTFNVTGSTAQIELLAPRVDIAADGAFAYSVNIGSGDGGKGHVNIGVGATVNIGGGITVSDDDYAITLRPVDGISRSTYITGSYADAASDAGGVEIYGGKAFDGRSGGNALLEGGEANGAGSLPGDAIVQGGYGYTFSDGGAVRIYGGPTEVIDGTGGFVEIRGGAAELVSGNGNGGELRLAGGPGYGETGFGGSVYIDGGASNAASTPGDVFIGTQHTVNTTIWAEEQLFLAHVDGGSPVDSITLDSNGLLINTSALGFFGNSPITQPTITGNPPADPVLVQLLQALHDYGLIINQAVAE